MPRHPGSTRSGTNAGGRITSLAGQSPDRGRARASGSPEFSARKEEILDTLEEIFLTEGFRAVTIGDLVRRARCSRGTLYDLASTKEALFIVVLDRLWRRLGLRAQEAIRSASDPAKQVEAYLTESSALFRPSPRFLEDVEAYAAARRLFDEHVAIAIKFLASLVESGIEEGYFRPVPPRLAAEVLSAAASQFAGRTDNAAEVIHQAVSMILYGLVTSENAVNVRPLRRAGNARSATRKAR